MAAHPVSRRTIGALTVVLIGISLALLAVLGGRALPERAGPPVEDIAVERTVLSPGVIELRVRNTGPDPVRIAQAFVNDTYVDVRGVDGPISRLGSADLRLDHPWQVGQPYLVSLLTSTGAVVEHQIDVAVPTPEPGPGFYGLMALLGTYVGIIPVLLGMALLPVLRGAGRGAVRVLLGVTVGLLAFLVVDGSLDGIELAAAAPGAFGGIALVALGAAAAFLLLTAVDRVLRRRVPGPGDDPPPQTGTRLALLIAVGIGLHNLGEGLAIGAAYAVGELALGAALVVGFALHNTTEGLAIVAPLHDRRPGLPLLAGLGLVAGAPAVVGALVGAAVNHAELSAFLLGVGVGAIVAVIVQIVPALRPRGGELDGLALGGVLGGVVIMYLTGLLVTA
jgi:zinc transporter ZupT